MIRALTYGIKNGIKHWRAGLIVYAILLSLALTIGIQVFQVLEASIGNSLELEKLVKQYDHTVIQDFLKVHGASLSPLFGQLRWYILVYLIFSVFINAGLFHVITNKPKEDWTNFWRGGARYFYPFLKIGFFFLLMFSFWTGIIALPASIYIGKIFGKTLTEMPMYYVGIIAIILILMYWMVLMSWSINTKLSYLQNDTGVWSSIKYGFKLTMKSFVSSPRLLFLFILFQLIIVVAHLSIEGVLGMTSGLLIAIFFITQQLLVFFRILWRIMVYKGFNHYNFDPISENIL